jgi:type III secretory pathway component EscU
MIERVAFDALALRAQLPELTLREGGSVVAREAAGVPVREDSQLAEALSVLALGQDVPEDMWPAVAEVLAWAYGLEKQAITPNR